MLDWLSSYVRVGQFHTNIYRNRSGANEKTYCFPIVQPDLYMHGAYARTPAAHYIEIQNVSYTDFNKLSMTRLLTLAEEANKRIVDRVPLEAPFEGTAEFTEKTEAYLRIPRLGILNMYGNMEEWENVYDQILEQGFTSYHPEVTTMLMTHPNLRINVFEKDNVFLVLTNAIKPEILFLLNGCIYYIRKKLGYVMDTPEECIEVFDNYIETIMSLQDTKTAELYEALAKVRRDINAKLQQLKRIATIKNDLAAFSKVFAAGYATRYKTYISTARTQIKDLLTQIQRLQKEMRNNSLILAGLSTNETTENILSFVDICNDLIDAGVIKELLIYGAYGVMTNFSETSIRELNSISFNMVDKVMYWEPDIAQSLYDNGGSVLHNYPSNVVELFKAIFIDETIHLSIGLSADILFDAHQNATKVRKSERDIRDDIYNTNCKCCPHPHIMAYNCWGDNEHLLTQALANEDYVSVMGIVNNVLCSINLADTPVLEQLLDCMDNYRDTAMYILDGEYYTYAQVLKKLKEKEEVVTDAVN